MIKILLYYKKVKHYFLLFILAIIPAGILEFLTCSFVPFYYDSEIVYILYKWVLIIALICLFEYLNRKFKLAWTEKKKRKLEEKEKKDKYKEPWEL